MMWRQYIKVLDSEFSDKVNDERVPFKDDVVFGFRVLELHSEDIYSIGVVVVDELKLKTSKLHMSLLACCVQQSARKSVQLKFQPSTKEYSFLVWYFVDRAIHKNESILFVQKTNRWLVPNGTKQNQDK